MKKIIFLAIIGIAVGCFCGISAATTIGGNLHTEFYAYETRTPDTVSHIRSLQGYRFNVRDAYIQGLSIYVNGRIASDISNKLANDPDYRVFGAYMQYDEKSGRFTVKLGRQYLYEGLSGFTLDGGRLKVGIGKSLSVTGFAGTMPGPSFFTYDEVNRWSDRNAFGGRVHVGALKNYSLNLSFLQTSANDHLDTRLIGYDMSYGRRGYSGNLRADYDLIFKRLKLLSLRSNKRFEQGHSVRIEYAYRKPSFGQSSIFSIVKSDAIHQVRLGGIFKTEKEIYVTGTVIYTKFSDDNNVNLRLGGIFKGQAGGIIYVDGYGGKKLGFYGTLRHKFTPDLELYTNIDMYNFKLDTEESDNETSLSAAFGARYNLMKNVGARAEVQVLTNPLYDYDTRAYLRLDYSFLSRGSKQGYAGGDAR